MKKIIISIFAVVGSIVLIQFVLKSINHKSPFPIAGSAIYQLGVLQDLLNRYEGIHKKLPIDLNELDSLAAQYKFSEVLKFKNPGTGTKSDWLYFAHPMDTSQGPVLVASPMIFTSENSEIKEFGKTGCRIALLKGGEIKPIPANEFK